MARSFVLNVNDRLHAVNVEADTPLLYVLRNDLGLAGPKFGCGLEQCGSCMVLLDDEALPSCRRRVAAVAGKRIVTLEGLATEEAGRRFESRATGTVRLKDPADYRIVGQPVPHTLTHMRSRSLQRTASACRFPALGGKLAIVIMNTHTVTVQKLARRVLNAYFAARLGRSLRLDDAELIARQRVNFLREFGPERLARLKGPELLRLLPHNLATDQPMDYWLEFRNDAVFSHHLFGSIAGGSAAKFGTWQDRRTGRWRAKLPGSRTIRNIHENEAERIVTARRQELLAAVEALRPFSEYPLQELDPEEVQRAVAAAAPRWKDSAWLHKSLHLNFPELVTWRATLAYLQSDLYHLGVVAGGSGPYACDIKLVQFWDSLPALAGVPIPLRYRLARGLAPRDHCCFAPEGGSAAWEAMLAGGYIALGPARTGSLAGAFSLSRKQEAWEGMESVFREAGVSPDPPDPQCLQDLLNLGHSLKEGSVVALLGDADTVLAVGEVCGGYRYSTGSKQPHQVPVRWLHQQCFALDSPVEQGGMRLIFLRPDSAAVAAVEASLLLSGVGIWPDFAEAVGSETFRQAVWTESDGLEAAGDTSPLEPPEGPVRQLMDMLTHKPQVILYGPPGTGKTYYAERTALEMVARANFRRPPSRLSRAQEDAIYGRDGSEPYIVSCTFHPGFAYEDFIEGYRPADCGFVLQPGIFKRLAAAAHARPDKLFVLIIDEINRGNVPAVFGELITVLEPAQRGIAHTLLSLSGERFTVPSNLYIIGTMNTADRSILLLDTALRRRFAFKELLPEPQRLQTGRIGDVSLSVWLRALNRRIVERLGREGRNLQVGHAYFMPAGEPAATLGRIAAIVRDDIWPLLQEYCYEDPRLLAEILASDQGGIYDGEAADLRHELFEAGREEALCAALQAIIAPEDRESEAKEGRAALPVG